MRIISPFQDYYDGVQVHGTDPKLVYERWTEFRKVEGPPPCTRHRGRVGHSSDLDRALLLLWHLHRSAPRPRWAMRKGCRRGNYAHDLHVALVAFCGHAYPSYYYAAGGARTPMGTSGVYPLGSKPDGVLNYMLTRDMAGSYPALIPKDQVAFLRGDRTIVKPIHKGQDTQYPFNDWGLSKWRRAQRFRVDLEIHRIVGAPVFALVNWWPGFGTTPLLIRNPRLADLNFASVIDPWTAYQELSMFLGSALAEQRDPNENISDADRAAMHGFGHKYAFRKEPKKK